MKWFKEWLERCRARCEARRLRRIKDTAEHVFQIEVYDDGFWLTVNGLLTVPMYLVTKECKTEECLAFLRVIREEFIKRNIEGK